MFSTDWWSEVKQEVKLVLIEQKQAEIEEKAHKKNSA